MIIDITTDMRIAAQTKADQLEAVLKGKSPWGLQAGFAYYWGSLGEQIFWECLRQCDIRHEADDAVRLKGGDDTDFWVWAKANSQRYGIDVKTCKCTHRHLFLPTQQYHKHPSGLYVAVKLLDGNEQKAEVVGWCTRDELKAIDKKTVGVWVDTHGITLEKLRPIEDLFDRLQHTTSSRGADEIPTQHNETATLTLGY